MTPMTMTLVQTSEVARHGSVEKMFLPPEVIFALRYPFAVDLPFSALNAYWHLAASKQNTPSAQSPSESESDIDAYGGSRRAAVKKNHRRSVQPTRDITPAHGEVRFSTRKAAKVSNYNEDDDDMFDDEADTLPQGSWAAAPDENVPAIDAVFNHRLREDTGQRYDEVILEAKANMLTGKEVTEPGRDDFEYYVRITIPNRCSPISRHQV